MCNKVLFNLVLIVSLLFFESSILLASPNRPERYTPPFNREMLGAYPWIAQISPSKCTAFLISNQHVLTSAHCLSRKPSYENLTVHFLNALTPFAVKSRRFISNPKANLYRVDQYDIAILELENSLELSTPELDLEQYTCTELFQIINSVAAGYQSEDFLRSVELTWQLPCPTSTDYIYTLKYSGNGQGGDSGSPLFYHSANLPYVIGLHEGSEVFDGEPNYYVSLSNNSDFINKYIQFSHISDSGIHYAVSVNIQDWKIVPHDLVTPSSSSISTTNLSLIVLSLMLNILLQAI